MKPSRLLASAALAACGLAWAHAAAAAPAPGRFDDVQSIVQGAVDAKTVPGSIVLVSQNGKRVFEMAVGQAGAPTAPPISANTIFWFASMSKPITAVAVMILVDEGKVRLDDPISKYLPAFAAPGMVKTAAAAPGGEAALAPARSAITVRELLTHTSGIVSGVGGPGIPPIKPTDKLADRPAEIAGLPLEAQPGSKWIYNNGVAIDLAGRIVEVASGQPLDRFLQTRILDPLGMKDTGFRAALAARPDTAGRFMQINPRFIDDPAVGGQVYFSGAAGLWGTAVDYDRFAQMLLNGGTYDGHRILKPATAAMMHVDQVHGLYHGNGKTPKEGLVFGLAMEVVQDAAKAGPEAPDQSFGWEGAGGTHFTVMPQQKAVAVIYAPSPPVEAAVEGAVTHALTSAPASR